MEVLLEITLFLSDEDEEEDEAAIALTKSIELPFPPYENLDLLLPGAGLEEPDVEDLESWMQWVGISPELAGGVFHISGVAYDIENNRFRAETDSAMGHEASPRAVEDFAQHMVEVFGFERIDLDDED
jgi:hypothetical protein